MCSQPLPCGLTEPTVSVDLEIDVIGLRCPLPVLKLKKRIAGLSRGALVRLVTSDPTTLNDVPSYCELARHSVLSIEQHESTIEFLIRIAEPA